MTNPLVVETAADVTPEWLTAALVAAGHDVEVASVETAPVGTGQMADSARITITYASDSTGAPATLVGKFPSDDPTSRSAGGRGGYGNEVGFYKHLATKVAGRSPACYLAELGAEDEFTLLLEDMAPAVQGDQIAGCTVAQAEAALVNLAGFHGPHWNDDSLFDVPSLASREDSRSGSSLLAEFMAAFTPEFVTRYAEHLSPEDVDLCTAFAARVVEWETHDTGSFGLVHGDYRLDNLLFGTTSTCPPATTVDWQTLRVGPPLRDVGYFIGTSLDQAERQANEEALVRVYYDALCGHGVEEYSFEQCWHDYRLGSLQGPLITILGSIGVKQTDRGDAMFMAMIKRSGQQARDLEALSLF